MELSEVVSNPHYAFPVVGVLLCALLVFAFGFKSPAQPPSFDFEDERRQPSGGTKKRKSVKKSSQNGHISHSNEKTSKSTTDKPASSPRTKHQRNNQANTDATDTKQLNKNKKNEANVLKSKDDNILEKRSQSKVKKEDQAGEWVQLLSRKEKKSRKREEHHGGVENETNEDAFKEKASDQRKTASGKNATDNSGNSPKSKKLSSRDDRQILVSHEDRHIPQDQKKVDEPQPLSNAEEPRKKSKANKAAKVEVNDNAGAESLESFQKSDPKSVELTSSAAENVDNGSEVQTSQADATPLPETKVSKKKLKNKVHVESEDVDALPKAAMPTETSDSKGVKENELAAPAAAKLSSPPVIPPAANAVAFDELADAWEEPKNQKKKKKARKDQ